MRSERCAVRARSRLRNVPAMQERNRHACSSGNSLHVTMDRPSHPPWSCGHYFRFMFFIPIVLFFFSLLFCDWGKSLPFTSVSPLCSPAGVPCSSPSLGFLDWCSWEDPAKNAHGCHMARPWHHMRVSVRVLAAFW